MSAAIAIVAVLVAGYAFWRVRKVERAIPPPDALAAWKAAARKALRR